MERLVVSDWLHEGQQALRDITQHVTKVMHDGAVSLVEAHARIKYLEEQRASSDIKIQELCQELTEVNKQIETGAVGWE
jgi:hypothetical protein